MLHTLGSDARLALRTLAKQPAFAATIVLILALGIGSVTSMWSVVHGVLLSPMPLEEPQKLVWLWSTNRDHHAHHERLSQANLVDFRDRQTTLTGVVGAHNRAVTWTSEAEARKLSVVVTTTDYFELLGARAALGRLFSKDDEDRPLVLLSHRFWVNQFGGRREVVGTSMVLDGETHTVIGVLPAEFSLPRATADIFQSTRLVADARRELRSFWVLGRLAPRTTLEMARADVSRISEELAVEYPEVNRGWDVTLTPLREHLVEHVRVGLWIAFAAVALVLLIACGNVANLLLARAAEREREVSIHVALGATRMRLAQRFLVEGFVVASLAGLAGMIAAMLALPVLLSLEPGSLPRIHEISIDATALLVAVGATSLTGVVLGLLPLLWAHREPSVGLRSGERSGASPKRLVVRQSLMVGQIAFAVFLLFGAGLLLRSFTTLFRVDPGFDTDRLAVVRMFFQPGSMSATERIDFFEELEAALANVPGVEAAGGASIIPLSPIRLERTTSFATANSELSRITESPQADLRITTPGFLPALGVALDRGRLLDRTDDPESQRVVVVNEALARRAWPGRSAIGETLHLGFGDRWTDWQVVGVVADLRYETLRSERRPAVYLPHTQQLAYSGLQYVVRTTGQPGSLLPALHRAVLDFAPDKPPHSVTTFDAILDEVVAQERYATLLMSVFAGLAATLAAIGVYSVLAYSINRRTREIGVRVALGAQQSDVLWIVVRQAIAFGALGLIVGLLLSQLLGSALSSLLFGVTLHDPATIASVSIGLGVVVSLAAWLPARRAMAVEPHIALRRE